VSAAGGDKDFYRVRADDIDDGDGRSRHGKSEDKIDRGDEHDELSFEAALEQPVRRTSLARPTSQDTVQLGDLAGDADDAVGTEFSTISSAELCRRGGSSSSSARVNSKSRYSSRKAWRAEVLGDEEAGEEKTVGRKAAGADWRRQVAQARGRE